jgi:hypothetical protein
MTGRAFLILANAAVRERAIKWIRGLPDGTRVEFRGPTRTLDQNDRMWAMLTDISRQHAHHGRKYDPADWKVLALTALGREMRFAPAIDGHGFVPLGTSSSKLSKAEMSDLIEFLFAFGAENGIVWSDPSLIQADSGRRAA